ncbi:MAG: glutathione S-transferase [Rhodobacteraceae bacterium HLUCCA12]|nr:MAG: glutathione S-transferase [Rhodobacteraceae bacterium HLUCCA12]
MTNPAYTVIGNAQSRAARVLWMLEELELPYEHVGVKPHASEVNQVNPSGKVPVLLVDGAPITDSTAIMQFLTDRHGKFTHAAGTLERARQDALTQLVLDEFDAVLWVAARHSFILPEPQRVPAVKESLRWEFTRNQSLFVRRMGDAPFLMGEAMTVPDIVLTHCGIWARAAKFEITEPKLQDYLGRMMQRPALRKALKAG